MLSIDNKPILPCKAKRQYLFILQVSRYCLLALQSNIFQRLVCNGDMFAQHWDSAGSICSQLLTVWRKEWLIGLNTSIFRWGGIIRIRLIKTGDLFYYSFRALSTNRIRVLKSVTLSFLIIVFPIYNPANTTRWPNAGLMLAHRLRRSANISPALGQHVVFAESRLLSKYKTFTQCRGTVGPESYAMAQYCISIASRYCVCWVKLRLRTAL